MHDGLAESAPLFLGLALGMRHAFDPDHIVAMSTIVSRERSIARAAFLGGAWGAGHCLSLVTVGLAVILFRVPMPESWSLVFERLVGVMLVVLGVTSLLWRRAPETEAGGGASHRPFAVGLVHGLAGSGALAIAVLATIPSRAAGLLYIALFGAGAIGGMMLITALFVIPLRFAERGAIPMRFAARARVGAGRWLPAAASVGSVVFGIWYLYQNA
jgi:high-affinity nickel-transport protein